MQVELTWSGPFSLSSSAPNSVFASAESKRSGVYVWAVDTSTGWRAYYVGETGDSFERRHAGHLRSYRTGSYSIHNTALLRAGSMEAVFQGFVYSSRKKPAKVAEFEERQIELERELAACLDTIQVFLAEVDADQRTRRRIETAILDAILASEGGLRGFELEKWSRWPRLASEAPLYIRSTGLPLPGVPETFTA